MKDLLKALWMSAVVVIVLIYSISDYLEVNLLRLDGAYAEATVVSLAGVKEGSKGSDTYFYEAELAGQRILLRSQERRAAGQRIAVLYDPVALRRYRYESPRPFTAYRIARRSDSTWWIMRETLAMLLLVTAIPGGIAWYFWAKVWRAKAKAEKEIARRERAVR